jgi:hypothetical protein
MGTEVHLLLDTQCSRLGPAYCMRGAADSLEWATSLDNGTRSMASKRPTFLLRKLPNTSDGSYVPLLKMVLIVLSRAQHFVCEMLLISWDGPHL